MSNVIIVGQPYTLRLDTGISLAGASSPNIIYKKPDKSIGTVAATIDGTVLVAAITGAQNDQSGTWRFHAAVSFTGDDAPVIGDVAKVTVKDRFYR
ncbi:MAG: hypothetical protein JXA71_19565 [Chitinispirillaceae bacterium]|nr:hypothetical protein [Chitinispirillaceae bacterium]